jgi:FkbM family methyltransferase
MGAMKGVESGRVKLRGVGVDTAASAAFPRAWPTRLRYPIRRPSSSRVLDSKMLDRIRELPRTLRAIVRHPLNRGRELDALIRFARWQIGSRLVPGPVVLEVTPGGRLLVAPGMRGATGSVYCGLLEFEDMSFVLHVTRPGDCFVDVGANVGVYTVLAASAGAHCIAFEPTPETFRLLLENVALNGAQDRVQAHAVAVGRSTGVVTFATGTDTVDHVVRREEAAATSLRVPVTTLDATVIDGSPTILKIDVEGFETEVVHGANDVLSRPTLVALIVEVNETSRLYGSSERAFDAHMRDLGFRSYAYEPFSRRLTELESVNRNANNTIYVRDLGLVRERLASARSFRVRGRTI